jgi:hypothetical protein
MLHLVGSILEELKILTFTPNQSKDLMFPVTKLIAPNFRKHLVLRYLPACRERTHENICVYGGRIGEYREKCQGERISGLKF